LRHLVTFDFHNTLATCDPWFFLEIRDLPVDVLRDIDASQLARIDRDEVVATYRSLRQEVVASGREVDAVTSVDRVFRALGLDIEMEAIAESIEHLMRKSMDHVAPVPGAMEAIHAVAASGITVGVVSSAVYHPFLEWTLAHFGVADTLAFVITSASSGFYKSDPGIYRAAMKTAGASPEHSLHVGDSLRWDVCGAQQAGMGTVWFVNGHSDAFTHNAEQATPDVTVHSMVNVAPLILDHLGRTRA
jgi:HAD superfamily hydrolase (TIGR01509 family)